MVEVVVVVVEVIFCTEQGTYSVRAEIRPRGYVAGYADFLVELHDRRRNRALEAVDALHLPVHRGVVNVLVEVAAHVLEVVYLYLVALVDDISLDSLGGSALEHARSDRKVRGSHRDGENARRHRDKPPPFCVAELAVEQYKAEKTREGEYRVDPEAYPVSLDAEPEYLLVLLLR